MEEEKKVSGENAAPQEDVKPLPDAKKTALLRYMAVLFAVAFLMVLLSMILQARGSRSTISELQASKSSALAKAEQLQDANRELENDLLAAQEEASASLDAADAERENIMLTYDALLIVLSTDPVEGDVEYSKAVETVGDNLKYLSTEARKAYDDWLLAQQKDKEASEGKKQ